MDTNYTLLINMRKIVNQWLYITSFLKFFLGHIKFNSYDLIPEMRAIEKLCSHITHPSQGRHLHVRGMACQITNSSNVYLTGWSDIM